MNSTLSIDVSVWLILLLIFLIFLLFLPVNP
ncbi:hypothetical protein Adeg_2103 [Ammonifex degensii KC4]|uniref:Uncharacterized protein n=1 Tax=Ammonifex degensii (strain DSM 10501 / KC4) TaxID=429009 RepID=C9RA51_AMMDK|nr:hypothetical protein Adeg_2103 [Ammonifex degensii KC4]